MSVDYRKHLVNARCRVLVKEPWYGVIASRFVWVKDDKVGTMGVSLHPSNKVTCKYSPEWISKLNVDELIAVICHEIEHIIRMHLSRGSYIKSEANANLHNIAADWVINGYKDNKRIKNLPDCGTFIPKAGVDDDKWKGCNLRELDPSMTTEEFYDWLKKNTKNVKFKKSIGSDSDGNGASVDGIQIETTGGSIVDIILTDCHSTWDDSTATKDEMRQAAKDLARSATQSAGKCPGGLEDSIKALAKPQHNWVHKWRRLIGRVAGNKRQTFARRNRRRDAFGVKGTSRHASIPIVLGADVSGSMTDKILERVFAEVESMSQHFKITLIQFDTEVTKVSEYHRGDWKKIAILGRGGTRFNAFFEYIEQNKCVGRMNAIITDGFDYQIPTPRNYPVAWVVVGRQGINYVKQQGLNWGEKILIEHDYE